MISNGPDALHDEEHDGIRGKTQDRRKAHGIRLREKHLAIRFCVLLCFSFRFSDRAPLLCTPTGRIKACVQGVDMTEKREDLSKLLEITPNTSQHDDKG